MHIIETRTWRIGRYTVRLQPRFDSPAWGQYLVFAGGKLIGKSFSMPDKSACEWLEHQHGLDRVTYAESSAQPKAHTLRGVARLRQGRRKNNTLALALDTEPA